MRKRNCKNCEKIFEVRRAWQIFCSNYCRCQFNRTNENYCFYCGNYSTKLHRDHVLPVSYRGVRVWGKTELVKACSECNCSLSNKIFEDIASRFEYLYQKYIKKYNLIQGIVAWDEEELQELGPSLRKKIKKMLLKRRLAEERVIYLKLRKKEFLNNSFDEDENEGKLELE